MSALDINDDDTTLDLQDGKTDITDGTVLDISDAADDVTGDPTVLDIGRPKDDD